MIDNDYDTVSDDDNEDDNDDDDNDDDDDESLVLFPLNMIP